MLSRFPHHRLTHNRTVSTSYKTDVNSAPYTHVTTKSSTTVCTETTKVPFTSTEVDTKTKCEAVPTKGGYHH
jgi:hypothetical protein